MRSKSAALSSATTPVAYSQRPHTSSSISRDAFWLSYGTKVERARP
jgi:hypothetical protein